MSLRTQTELANLRRERALLAKSVSGNAGARLAAVLRSGLARLSVTPINAGAPRGGRLPYEQAAFDRDRRWRLTASMLPFWLGLEGNGKPTTSRAEIVRVLGSFGGMYKGTFSEAAQQIMNYGRENEVWGLVGYMEMTRSLVGLGSTRVRENRVSGEHVENYGKNKRGQWEWHETLSATPDGFAIEAIESGANRGLGFKGLIEVKCPAGLNYVGGVKSRFNADIRINPEYNTYLLLQAFQQLLVCTEANHIDLVHWKRGELYDDQHSPNDTHDFVWIARLYPVQRHMNAIRAQLRDSVQLFAEAIEKVRGVDGDSDTDTESETQRKARHKQSAAEWARLLASEDEENPPDEQRAYLSPDQKETLVVTLHEWAYECMRWRNGHEPNEGYPWRSKKELRSMGMPETGLAHRFDVNTGRAANHEFPPKYTAGAQNQISIGYADIKVPYQQGALFPNRPLEARDIWGAEPIGFH